MPSSSSLRPSSGAACWCWPCCQELRTPQYGYSLRQALASAGLPIEEGTLYPLLRRLEAQGVLDSAWNTDGASPRRYYRLSPDGERLYEAMAGSWRRQVDVMDGLLK